MQNLLELIHKRLHWAVFLLLEIVSLVLLLRANSYQGSVWTTQANAVTGQVLTWESQLLRYMDLGQENSELVQQNLTLQHNVEVLRHELGKLQHDSTRTELAIRESLHGLTTIPAQVISNSVRQRDNLLVIDRGSADGVQP